MRKKSAKNLKKEAKNVTANFKLEESLAEKVVNYCEEQDISLSQFYRKAVKEKLQKA